MEDIAEKLMDFVEDSICHTGIIIGYYDTIVDAFNYIIKNSDANFAEGELNSPEWDGYDDAWYLDYSEDEIYLGKAYNNESDRYFMFEGDLVYVEEDFVDGYLKTNDKENVIVFGFDDIEEDDNTPSDKTGTCLCLTDDKMGFSFCADNEYGHQKLVYRGNKKLTEDEAWSIVAAHFE